MAIYKISIKTGNYPALEAVITGLKDAIIMKAVEYPKDPDSDQDDSETVVFLKLDYIVDLSYILLHVGGKQLRHPA